MHKETEFLKLFFSLSQDQYSDEWRKVKGRQFNIFRIFCIFWYIYFTIN